MHTSRPQLPAINQCKNIYFRSSCPKAADGCQKYTYRGQLPWATPGKSFISTSFAAWACIYTYINGPRHAHSKTRTRAHTRTEKHTHPRVLGTRFADSRRKCMHAYIHISINGPKHAHSKTRTCARTHSEARTPQSLGDTLCGFPPEPESMFSVLLFRSSSS